MDAGTLVALVVVVAIAALTMSFRSIVKIRSSLREEQRAFHEIAAAFEDIRRASSELEREARELADSPGFEALGLKSDSGGVPAAETRLFSSSFYNARVRDSIRAFSAKSTSGTYYDHFGEDLPRAIEHAAKVGAGEITTKQAEVLIEWFERTPATSVGTRASSLHAVYWRRSAFSGASEDIDRVLLAGKYRDGLSP